MRTLFAMLISISSSLSANIASQKHLAEIVLSPVHVFLIQLTKAWVSSSVYVEIGQQGKRMVSMDLLLMNG